MCPPPGVLAYVSTQCLRTKVPTHARVTVLASELTLQVQSHVGEEMSHALSNSLGTCRAHRHSNTVADIAMMTECEQQLPAELQQHHFTPWCDSSTMRQWTPTILKQPSFNNSMSVPTSVLLGVEISVTAAHAGRLALLACAAHAKHSTVTHLSGQQDPDCCHLL